MAGDPGHSTTNILGCPRLVWAVLAIVAVAGLFLITRPTIFLIQYIYDDSFYYFTVAKNIVNGFGSTFDQLNPTNGYHPLWMMVLLPVYKLFGNWPNLAFRVVLVLQLGLWLVSSFILFRYLASRLSIWAWLPALLFWANPWFFHRQVSGMEISVTMLFLMLLVQFLGRSGGVKGGLATPACFGLGLLMGGLFLARLDTALIALVVFVFLLVRTYESRIKSGAAFLSGAAVLGVPYVIWNIYSFGHLWPVSMHVKHATLSLNSQIFGIAWKKIFWPVYFMLDSPRSEIVILLGIGVVFLFLWIANRQPGKLETVNTESRSVLTDQFPFIMGVVLHWCYICVFGPLSGTGKIARDWYFAPEMVTSAILFAVALNLLPVLFRSRLVARGLSTVAGITLVLFSIFSIVVMFSNEKRFVTQVQQYAASNWIGANVPVDAIVGAFDAGQIGYFSGRRCVNLDGLISSFEYVDDYLKAGRVDEWLIKQNVSYLANEFGGDSFPPAVELREKGWGLDVVYERSWERAVSNPRGKPIPRMFRVWKLTPP